MRPDSLAFRLVAGAAVWALVILAGGGYLLSSVFRDSVQRSFDTSLDVMLGGLIADAEMVDGDLVINQRSGQPRFDRPFSGLYWQVTYAAKSPADAVQVVARSRSLWENVLPPLLGESEAEGVLRRGEIPGPQEQRLRVVEREVRLPGAEQPLTFLVAGDVRDLEADIQAFDGTLALAVGILTIGLIIALLIQVRYGLRPLHQVEEGLADIRSGRAEKLTGEFPTEIAPLATEVNQLLEHNAQVVERARTHVGNLAHALKTPLSVLNNEAAISGQKQPGSQNMLAETVSRQVALMRRQVDHYLSRARAAATGAVLGARAPVRPVVDDLVRTLHRIHRDREIDVTVDSAPDLAFRGEKQDLEEMLGNLLDNAFKWAESRITVTTGEKDGQLTVTVADDGPGLAPEERARVLKRGARLDESVPGSGLGLSIVADIAGLYQGGFSLDESTLGGVAATITLPLATA